MIGLIVGHVGQEEKVAIAVVKFKLWSRDIVVVETQVGEEEALDVALTFDRVAH